jgi:hypothetical protein
MLEDIGKPITFDIELDLCDAHFGDEEKECPRYNQCMATSMSVCRMFRYAKRREQIKLEQVPPHLQDIELPLGSFFCENNL